MRAFHFSTGSVFAGLLLAGMVSTGVGAQEATDKLPKDPSLATGKLANGLTYYIRNNHKPEHKVELRLVINAGSILEEDDQQGLAHFMEHMNFNGTKNFEKNELVSYLQSIGVQFGADLNAYTGFDQTVFILPIPTDKAGNLEKGFQILEDWAHNASLTDQDIDDERGVVLEESRLGKGAEDRMLRKYFPKLMDGTKYAERLPIGKDDILKKFKYQRIKDFYADWYRPDLQAVVVVGDLDTATAKKLIMDHFAHLKNPSPEKRRKYETIKPWTEPQAMVVTDKEATNSMLAIMYPYTKKKETVTVTDYKQGIVRNLALGIINHRLNEKAQAEEPPFPFAMASFDDMVHGFESLSFYSGFSKSGPDSAINAIAAEILKLKKFGVTQAELDQVKKEMAADMDKMFNERNTTDSKAFAEECIRNFTDKEPIPGIANENSYYKTFIPAITVAEVNTTVKNWLNSKNLFTLVTGPNRPDVKLPSEKELTEKTEEAFKQSIAQATSKKVADKLIDKKPVAGSIISEEKADGFDAITYTLSNGIKVTVKSTDFKSDEIMVSGIKKGGSNNYTLDDRSNVHFATDVVESMGLAEFTPTDLEKVLAGKNVSVKVNIGEINDVVKGNSNVKDFETMMQLLYLNLTSPRRDESLFKSYKSRQITSLEFMTANPRIAFFDTTVKMLYENNPMARMVIPRPGDFEKINMDRVIEIYRDEFGTADGYQFFIVGNIKPDVVKPLIETYLGGLRAVHRNPSYKDNGVRPAAGNHDFTLHKGDEKQSIIFEVFAGLAPYSEDFAMKVQALAEVLNIKVIEDLREKMGGIYAGGFNGSVAKEPFERYSMVLQLPCGPENVEKLLSAADYEIDSLKTQGPDMKDLDKVKNQWKEKHTVSVKENGYWLGQMESVIFWGRDKDRVLNYETYVDRLTPVDLQETAKKVFSGNNKFTSILKPADKK